jgi:hypothetical protein
LDADIPYFNLVEYNQRTLKTTNSQRSVPLVPAALSALKEHLTSHESDLVFPKYNDRRDTFDVHPTTQHHFNILKTTLVIPEGTAYSVGFAFDGVAYHLERESKFVPNAVA